MPRVAPLSTSVPDCEVRCGADKQPVLDCVPLGSVIRFTTFVVNSCATRVSRKFGPACPPCNATSPLSCPPPATRYPASVSALQATQLMHCLYALSASRMNGFAHPHLQAALASLLYEVGVARTMSRREVWHALSRRSASKRLASLLL